MNTNGTAIASQEQVLQLANVFEQEGRRKLHLAEQLRSEIQSNGRISAAGTERIRAAAAAQWRFCGACKIKHRIRSKGRLHPHFRENAKLTVISRKPVGRAKHGVVLQKSA